MHITDVNDLAATMAAATRGDVVRLQAGATYDPDRPVVVPPGVTLRFNGAVIRPTTDHDVLVLSNGARLTNAAIDVMRVEGGFSSRALVIDSGRADTRYQLNRRSTVRIDGTVWLFAPRGEGTGVALHAADGKSLSTGNHLELTIHGFDTQIDAHAESSFINAIRLQATLLNAGTYVVHHRGQFPFLSQADLIIQPHPETAYGIRNDTAQPSLEAWVRVFDEHLFTEAFVSGDKITVQTNAVLSPTASVLDTEESEGTVIHQLANGRLELWDSDGDRWQFRGDNGQLALSVNDVERWELGRQGWLRGTNKPMILPQLSSDPDTDDLADGECTIYLSDGSDGVTGDAGDVIAAVHAQGAVKTAVLMDFGAA